MRYAQRPRWSRHPAVVSAPTPIVIIGAGLVGMSLALRLHAAGVRSVVVESVQRDAPTAAFGERYLALSRHSLQALSALGVALHDHPEAGALREIVLSSAGEFGRVALRAADYGLSSFGSVVPARILAQALSDAVARAADIELLRPAQFLSSRVDGVHRQVTLKLGHAEQVRRTALLVAADGANSSVGADCGVSTESIAHGDNTALVCNLQLERAHEGVAHERLCRSGPLALLPLPGARMGMVWTLPTTAARRLLRQDDATYLAAAQDAFGYRLGRFTAVGPRHRYALAPCAATRTIAQHAVLVGNAAQSIHPIGAQGFNLGLRDVLALADSIALHAPGSTAQLQDYQRRRASDRTQTIAFSTQSLQAATQDGPVARLLRPLALGALALSPHHRLALVRFGLGIRATA